MTFMLIPTESFAAIAPAIEYNPISLCISIAMIFFAAILGIAYPIFAVLYLIKTKGQKTKIQQMKKLIIWLIIIVIIIKTLIYFAPFVRQIGVTYSGKEHYIQVFDLNITDRNVLK